MAFLQKRYYKASRMNQIKYGFIFLIWIGMISACRSARSQSQTLPNGFSYVKDAIPDIEVDLRYFGDHNFLGRRVVGYEKPVLIFSTQATQALIKVQAELKSQGLGLKVFDAYRPQRAVNDFIQWAAVLEDTIAKREFYPDLNKKDLFKLGYVAKRSGHSRGSTIDLTIINLSTKEELDMGGNFDFFGPVSHQDAKDISNTQMENRLKLKKVMMKYGFRPYHEEWWHFTLNNEPFPKQYFNFLIQ